MNPEQTQARSSWFAARGRGLAAGLLCAGLLTGSWMNQASGDVRTAEATISVAGEVRNPGQIKIPSGETLTLTGAIQKAGGLTPFAYSKKVSLIRKRSSDSPAIALDYDRLIKDGDPRLDPILQDGDRITVPKRTISY